MRIGYAIAAGALIVAAILFAPRAGPPDIPRDAAPSDPVQPDAPPVLRELRGIYDAMPRTDLADTYPNDALRELRAMEANGHRQVTPEEYGRAEGLLLEGLEHARRLSTDRWYREAWAVRTRVRLHPVLRDLDLVVAHEPPWLVFVQGGGKGDRAFANSAAGWLKQLADRFREELSLPAIADAARESERILKLMVFRNRKAFFAYFVKCGQPESEATLSIYRPSDRWSLTFREKGVVGKGEVRQVLYPGVHQLLHFHAKLAIERVRPTRGEVEFSDRRIHSQLLWFQRGLVRLFSNVDIGPDGRLAFFRFDPDELEPLVESRESKRRDWPLSELIKIPNAGVMRRRAQEVGLHPWEAGRLRVLFDVQSYALVAYLWSHEDENIRRKCRAYLKSEFAGKSGYPQWKKVWGKEDDDWSELEKSFEAWLKKKMPK